MKKTVQITLLMLPLFANAQGTFNENAHIDVNKFNARLNVHGDMWWDPVTGDPKCEFPKGGGVHASFAGAVWMSGYDQQGTLKVAAQTYRQDGNDYWPGPINSNSAGLIQSDTVESGKWAKVWKVTKAEIDAFLNTATHTIANTPSSILTWPARGNAYAEGRNGAILFLEDREFAPWVEQAGDPLKYEPLLGDYPLLKGDQMLWTIFNDYGPSHAQTNSAPMQMELKCAVYGYNRNSAVDNLVIYEYTISNRSADDLDSFRIGLWTDIDLGYYMDDFVGFDSSRSLGIVYNGDTRDLGGFASANVYDSVMPMVGVRILESPDGNCNNIQAVSSFMYFNNNSDPVTGNPFATITQMNNILRSRWRNGQHLTNDGMLGTGVGPTTNYVYTGDPQDSTGWSECQLGNVPDDRRFVIATQDTLLKSGGTMKFAFALLATDLNSNNSCASGATFAGIKDLADTALYVYCNPLPPLPTAVINVMAQKNVLHIYPNPASAAITISGLEVGATIWIHDAAGSLVAETSASGNEAIVSTATLSPGLYQVAVISKSGTLHNRFVKL